MNLRRVIHVDKGVRNAELLRHLPGHSGRAIAFAGVVAAGYEGDAALAGIVRLGFGYFAGDKRIGPSCNRRLEIALGPAGTPGDALQGPGLARHHQHRAAQHSLHMVGQGLRVSKSASL